jgi:hypothetical protein
LHAVVGAIFLSNDHDDGGVLHWLDYILKTIFDIPTNHSFYKVL